MNGSERERQELVAGSRALGIAIGCEQLDALLAFLGLLYRWNESAGLTTVERADAVRLHLLDSLSALPLLNVASELADLGSGGGFPGIPLALLRPGLPIVLVEKRRRKCSFLREVVRELALANCEVHEGDALQFTRAGGSFETTIARAFLPPPRLFSVLTGAARNCAIAMLGPAASETQASRPPAGWELQRSLELALPGGGERRSLIALRRVAAA